MALSLSKKNVLSIMAMTLTTISLISPADAQATCTSTSPDCCWVVESWKNMGRTTSVSATSATACCSGIPGVRCSSSGIVSQINWIGQSLKGSIPSSLGNLFSIKYLYLKSNQLSGSIPSSLGNLKNLQELALHRNQLSGPIPSSLGNLVNLQTLILGFNQLTGSIPSSLGNLFSIKYLYLDCNKLTGSIPPSLGNLENIKKIGLVNNTGLNGTFTPQCTTLTGQVPEVGLLGTNVTVCGCVAESTPEALYPPPETDVDCLASRHASGPAPSLSKRTQVSGQVAQIGNLIFKCHVDAKKNPFADCLNSMAALCDPARTFYNKTTCKTAVNQMYGQMSEYWQKVRKACGRWSWTQDGITYTGEGYTSSKCATANSDLIANAYYSVWNPLTNANEEIKVSSALTDSTNVGLWGQVAE